MPGFFVLPLNPEVMMKLALYDYVPQRMLKVASQEDIITRMMILGFKDGRNVYTRWAARKFAYALSLMDLTDTVIVCVPASTAWSHTRRWKRFLDILCYRTGAVNGFGYVKVSGSRKRAHVTGDYELCTNIKRYVHLDAERLRGRKVLVIDDIYTTGQSSASFIAALEAVGAEVVMAMFLAKTRRWQAHIHRQPL